MVLKERFSSTAAGRAPALPNGPAAFWRHGVAPTGWPSTMFHCVHSVAVARLSPALRQGRQIWRRAQALIGKCLRLPSPSAASEQLLRPNSRAPVNPRPAHGEERPTGQCQGDGRSTVRGHEKLAEPRTSTHSPEGMRPTLPNSSSGRLAVRLLWPGLFPETCRPLASSPARALDDGRVRGGGWQSSPGVVARASNQPLPAS
jgi:hypothetical protein